jgi:lysocardiolipin and lysophospholipid acyltransferase
MGYGQSYYTLRSIFMGGVPPPAVHIHLRMFDVASGVPVGAIPSRKMVDGPLNKHPAEVEIPEKEKETFDLWLRELWQEKDESITRFHETGSFSEERLQTTGIEVPLRLHRKREFLDAFCFFLPACAFFIWGKIRQ